MMELILSFCWTDIAYMQVLFVVIVCRIGSQILARFKNVFENELKTTLFESLVVTQNQESEVPLTDRQHGLRPISIIIHLGNCYFSYYFHRNVQTCPLLNIKMKLSVFERALFELVLLML